ncbi:hypothetical protein CHMI_03165 [Cellulomonas hominis]|nr:hypothetical protein CHMI_03165 [Cellulomonas hominis]
MGSGAVAACGATAGSGVAAGAWASTAPSGDGGGVGPAAEARTVPPNRRAGSAMPARNASRVFARESTRQSFVASSPSTYVVTARLNHAKPITSSFAPGSKPWKKDVTQAGLVPPISEAPTSASRIFLSVIDRSWSSVRP